jgi:hypothetical protein
MEAGDYYDALLSKVMQFIRSAEFIKGLSKGEAQQISDGRGVGAGSGPPLIHTYIHTYIHC